MFETDFENALVAFVGILILFECVALGAVVASVASDPSNALPPAERYLTRAKWINLANTFILFVCSVALMVSGMIWMPLLLFLAAAGGVLAFRRLDAGRLGEARLFGMLGTGVTLVVAAISFGRSTIGTGMGPLHAALILILAGVSGYVVFLVGLSENWGGHRFRGRR